MGQCPLKTPEYLQFWNPAKRNNYSGTLVLAKRQPLSCRYGLGIEKFDEEGRLITLEYKDYFIVNVYVPNLNPHSTPDRLDFRIEWDRTLKEYVTKLPKPVIMCGDFNVAREYIDIYPENQKNTPEEPLFQSEERAGFESLLSAGFVDVFRAFYPQKEGAYTWWGPRPKSRQENKGSRLDYFLVSGELLTYVQSIKHHTTTLCSDHCPISIIMGAITFQQESTDEDMAVRWRTIDWPKMENELFRKQSKLALAAYNRDWETVKIMQDKLVASYAARDKAMLVLYSLALDPVAESTADKKSFFARKGRSAHDAYAYILRELNQENPPRWIVRADVAAFFDNAMHSWLIENIPMDKAVLRKFLRAGVVKNGELFETNQYLAQCTDNKNHVKTVTRHIWADVLEKAEENRYIHGIREYYKLRKETIERDFALAKELHGFRYTQEYGQARMEWKTALTFACMNLKKLAKVRWKQPKVLHLFPLPFLFPSFALPVRNKSRPYFPLRAALSTV